jgi:hypothetical protein
MYRVKNPIGSCIYLEQISLRQGMGRQEFVQAVSAQARWEIPMKLAC